MPKYEQPEDLPGVYKDLKIGETLTISGEEYTVEILGGYATSFGGSVNVIPSRKRGIVCALDENKTLFNITIK